MLVELVLNGGRITKKTLKTFEKEKECPLTTQSASIELQVAMDTPKAET